MHKSRDHRRGDLAEAAALERRRYRELQRQSRVFDARVRTTGVDTEALDKQINDRRIQEGTQKAWEESIGIV